MNWNINKQTVLAVGIGAAALVAVYMIFAASAAQAGDLGGSCCADLEERIAELEATAARKGNKKVNLTVSGQVNTALLYVDVEDYNNTTVIQNGNEESRVGFYVNARINNDFTAGATLEIEARELGLLNLPLGGMEPRVRQSNVWIKSETLGKFTLGKAEVATHGFDEITTANTAVANKPLSLGALSDAYVTGIDVPFDGQFGQVVRYDSPSMAGFRLSASWGASFDATASDGNGDTYDIALRYAGEHSGFRVAGGVGYRESTDLDINILNIAQITIPTGDVSTILAAGSIMHMGSGLFVTANYADQDWDDLGFKLKGYAFMGGLENQIWSIGKTTFYGEFNRFELEPDGGTSGEIDMYGVGIVQAIDAAAMDLYITYRNYDLGDLGGDDLVAATAGARIRF